MSRRKEKSKVKGQRLQWSRGSVLAFGSHLQWSRGSVLAFGSHLQWSRGSVLAFGSHLQWSRGSVLAFGSHPTEAVGFLGRKKSSARLRSEGK